jgi:hypothetical protein
MPSARAVKTSGAKMTRFSTALMCAAIRRRAQGDCALSVELGLAIAAMSPRTMMRSSMYGTHNRPVIAAVRTSQNNSLDMTFPPIFPNCYRNVPRIWTEVTIPLWKRTWRPPS